MRRPIKIHHAYSVRPLAIAITTAVAALSLSTSQAFAIDTQPAGYVPLPAGSDGLSLHWQYQERKGLYAAGKPVLSDASVTSNVMTATYGHYMKLGSLTAAPGFMLTCGENRAGGMLAAQGHKTGCMDLIVGMPTWVLNKPSEGRYLGISPYASLPTGDYDHNSALSMGENRWKLGVNAGYVTPLIGRFVLDLVGDAVFPGRNTNYSPFRLTEKEKPFYSVQMHLRYQIDAGTRLSFSHLHYWGGESTIAGVAQNDRMVRDRYRVGFAKFIDAHNEIQIDTGEDIDVNTSMKVKRYTSLRLNHLFY